MNNELNKLNELFELDVIKEYCEICKSCNEDDDSIKDYTIQRFEFDDSNLGSIIFYILKGNNKVIVQFPGSRNEYDSKVNVNFMKKKFKEYGYVHGGYLDRYNKIKELLFSQLELIILQFCEISDNNSNQILEIIFLGYSLGGYCILPCIELSDKYKNYSNIKISYCSIASPKIGNREFIISCNKIIKNIIRIIHPKDVITSIPPTLFGFKEFPKNKCLLVEPQRRGQSLINLIKVAINFIKSKGSIEFVGNSINEYHDINNYILNLEKLK
jgi:hypothetical protein